VKGGREGERGWGEGGREVELKALQKNRHHFRLRSTHDHDELSPMSDRHPPWLTGTLDSSRIPGNLPRSADTFVSNFISSASEHPHATFVAERGPLPACPASEVDVPSRADKPLACLTNTSRLDSPGKSICNKTKADW